MLKTLLHSVIRRFEKSFGYDAGYMHEIVESSVSAAWKFSLVQLGSNHRQDINADAWHAAHLAGALSEDCGPCTQLCVDMASRDGMDPQKIAALIRGDIESAGAGERGLISLGYAVTFARIYPALKRALGHGQACSEIVVRDEIIPVRLAA